MKKNNSVSRLNVGCFDQPVAGWMNTDITKHLWVAKIPGLAALLWRLGRISKTRYLQHKNGIFRKVEYLNINKPLPIREQQMEAVFCSHVLEHLYREQAIQFINECHRILRPSGVLRISVPDAAYAIDLFWPDEPDKLMAYFFEANALRNSKDQHHWMYTKESLKKLFIEGGFSESQVTICSYREGKCSDLDKLDNRPEHSIFVEGTK